MFPFICVAETLALCAEAPPKLGEAVLVVAAEAYDRRCAGTAPVDAVDCAVVLAGLGELAGRAVVMKRRLCEVSVWVVRSTINEGGR
jgi:hypothetical protein